jgi:hypothetical protein
MRRLATLALVVAVAVAGCAAPAIDPGHGTAARSSAATPGDGTATAEPPGTESATPTPTATPRPDPDDDRQGWEGGYWHDDPLQVTPGDGYNGSELEALVARAMARVEVVRDVEFDRAVDVDVVTRSNLSVGGGGEAGGGAAVQRARYRALFLVGDGRDAGATSNETRQASVNGYYSAERDEIVLVSPTETPRIDELTLAHELVHAYQFRNREIRVPRSPTADQIEAVVAVIEGEADLVERRYRDRCGPEWSCARPGSGDGSGTEASQGGDDDRRAGVHMGLYLLSYFPYAEGTEFVTDVYEAGGWDAVADLFRSPPRSTEQVIHRDADDRPASVYLPDASGDGWTRVAAGRSRESTVVGQRGVATMFMYTAYDDRPGSVVPRESFVNVENGSVDRANPLDYGVNYSMGWGGDALATYRPADGGDALAYVWRLQWDDESAAREFHEGYRKLLRHHGAERVASREGATYWRLDGPFAGGYYVALEGQVVTIVHAPSIDALGAVWDPADRQE